MNNEKTVQVELWIIAVIMLTILLLTIDGYSAEPVSVERVDAAIASLIVGAPRHRLNRDSDLRMEWARDFITAGQMHGIDPFLLVVIAKRESTFRPGAIGGIGERTAMQIHPWTARRYGCDTSTRLGSMECAALILDERRRACGTIEQALAGYASRGQCSGYKKSKRLRGIADSRLKLAAELRAGGA